MKDASNRKDIREAEKAAKLAEEARRNFLVATMSIAPGRAWIYELLEFCGTFSGDFTNQPLLEAFTKGQRNVGLKIFNELSLWCPDQYITMIKEANYVRSAASQQPRSEDADGRDQGPVSPGADWDPYDYTSGSGDN